MQRDHTRFAWWLAAAIFLHALVLLIPAHRHFAPTTALQSLTITLSAGRRAPPPSTAAAGGPAKRAIAAEPESVQSPARARPAPARAHASERPTPGSTAGAQAREPGASVTAARLLDHAHRREWAVPEPSEPPRPGVFSGSPSEPWLATPATSAGQSGADLPAGDGVIDQWLAADGSRNFMIRAPGGQLLCGRAEAWNPMSPLIEPVIMYRACGDGRRSFEMPPRGLLR